jgi:acyl-CoA synthetase (AMP-forming)/AMP-acid ligase II
VRSYHLRHILEDCDPALVLAGDECGAALAAVGAAPPVLGLDALAAAPVPADAALPEVPELPEAAGDLAALIYTSGSTAMPKAVMCTHSQMRFAAAAIQQRLELRAEDVIGCFLPLAFDYGLYQILLACSAGAALALGTMSEVGPGFLGRLRDWDVTVLPAVPSMTSVLLRLGARTPGLLPPLRVLTNTGAHLPTEQVDAVRGLFPGIRLYPMFGLTECKRVSILLPEEIDLRPGSVGRPLAGTRCLVVDASGRPVPDGTVGELVVLGPHVMAGYWRAPELDALRYRTYDGERALFTGDRCSMDADGYLYFHGRDDDIYKSRGFRVSSLEVEAAAVAIPGVHAAALVVSGSPQPVLFASAELGAREIAALLRERLDEHKLPAQVRVVEQLPLTGNGKVDKTALRELLEPAR